MERENTPLKQRTPTSSPREKVDVDVKLSLLLVELEKIKQQLAEIKDDKMASPRGLVIYRTECAVKNSQLLLEKTKLLSDANIKLDDIKNILIELVEKMDLLTNNQSVMARVICNIYEKLKVVEIEVEEEK